MHRAVLDGEQAAQLVIRRLAALARLLEFVALEGAAGLRRHRSRCSARWRRMVLRWERRPGARISARAAEAIAGSRILWVGLGGAASALDGG
jgi:hypothetical protein